MTSVFRKQDGQATVMAAVFMIGLLGMCGFVIDVGSWFRQQRVVQSTVDAAALAGAQDLPVDPAGAVSDAMSYASKNGGVAGATFSIGSRYSPNDSITVKQTTGANGFFSKLFGIDTVNVGAKATAIAQPAYEVNDAAPIVVNIHHPMLSGTGCPCFNLPTTIPLGKNGEPGSFAMVDLDNTDTTGTVGSSTLSNWITNGFNGYLPLGQYYSDPGAKFSDNKIQSALVGKYGQTLMFPIYDSEIGSGSGADYHVIGWAAFHLTNVQVSGNSGQLSGWFTRVVWDGVLSPQGPGNPSIPDLGVYSVALVD
ncbi:MAG TPA: pilus assembly protein TadG-related protein [Gaiellaceae bacterium]